MLTRMPSESERLPPLIVLSSHRSGSSAFMGLLVEAGLHVGEVIPPAADNPRGFFENRNLVDLNKWILFQRDRDWTCPPAHLDHRKVDLSELRRVGDELSLRGEPWGLKDPRMLFTLPAWAAALGPCMLVGVHRNSEAVARSMAARGDLSLDEARSIAHAYAERLAEAHKRLGFPIISFDSDPDEFVDHTRKVADVVGLDSNRAADGSSFDSRLVHHRSLQEPLHAADDYLEAAARQDFDHISTHTAATIVRSWQDLPSDHARSLPLHLGPRFSAKRDEMIRASIERLPDISAMAIVEPERREFEAGGMSHVSMTPSEFMAMLDGAEERWSHVIAPVLFDLVPPDDLQFTLDKIRAHLEDRAVVGVGGWFLDGDDLPSNHIFSPADVKANRHSEPYLHHIDEFAAATLGRGLYLADIRKVAGGRSHVFVTSDRSIPRTLLGTSELRDRYADLEAKAASLEAELTRTASELDSVIKSSRRDLDNKQRELERATSDMTAYRERTRRLNADLVDAKRKYQRLRSRRSVRWVLAATKVARPLFRLIRRIRKLEPKRPTGKSRPSSKPSNRRGFFGGSLIPNHWRKVLLTQKIKRKRAGSNRVEGPLVSIVILTRNGVDHLSRLLPALNETRYRSFEVIVVDNGSTDGTDELLTRTWTFPLQTVQNGHNTSFSEGNDQGADLAQGEHLLFLNNDIEPINPGWLGAMVDALEEEGVVACGALLVYPVRGEASDLTVQHTGIRFEIRSRGVQAINVSASDPLAEDLAGVREVPAATAAALIMRADDFSGVGGFSRGYVYGAEDVDLCLKLKDRGGRIVVTGESLLFHHESATQDELANDIKRINRLGNRQLLMETWGSRLTRSVQQDRFGAGGRWGDRRRRVVAITLTQNDPSKGWGDYYTAHELGDAFTEAGWAVIYAERHQDMWYGIGSKVDLVISLLDSYDVRQAPEGAVRIAWIRNWVDRWVEHPWFDQYDIVTTSSQAAADAISDRSRFDPEVIPLATNPERFWPGPANPTFECDYAFTGNNWGKGREIIPLLDIHPDERFLLFGKGWDKDPRAGRYWRGHLDYDLLPELYRSSKIVLDDTAGPTKPHAFLNGRVFDALAAGALVITDNVEGSYEMFGGRLPSYRNRAELRDHLDHYLSNDQDRSELVEELREHVLASHTYSQRPAEFLKLVTRHIDAPKAAVKIGVPNHEEKASWGDTHFAEALASGLSKQGMPTEVHILPEWDLPQNQAVDVVIHIRGLTNYAPKPAHINVLWIISHPDDVTLRECQKYDLILVGSKQYADWLDSRLDVPVAFMPQATDERRFRPVEPEDELASEILFVGNSRGQTRSAIDWAVESRLPLTIYGKGWDGLISSEFLADEYFPNERLASLYSSAKVVLNDHWPDMRDSGFISNRIYDALASGAVVITDQVDGLEDMFGDLVPTYSNRRELEGIVRRLLSDEQERLEIVREASKLVLDQHTFTRRAEQVLELISPLLSGRYKDIEGRRHTAALRGGVQIGG